MRALHTRRGLFHTTALAGALAVSLVATGAHAQARTYNIPAQSLAESLRQYGLASGEQIIFAERMVSGRQAPALQGSYSADDALRLLLADSGLRATRTTTGGIMIESASDPQSGSAAGDGADGTVQALIVTAQKREENVQDVPIAISAFTQEDLTRSQVAGGPDLITQVPNMTFTKTNFNSYSIQLRGIGTQAISATTDPGVAVAFNNTPFIRNRFFEQEFYDLQRMEVLRGPQGTLYGRNATAGVVNIISQKPKFAAEAKLSGDVANYSSTRLEGMVNIPLVEDKVAVRLAGAWTKRNGYATNEITSRPIDGRDLWSTRLSLRFAPTDALDVNLIWEHFQEDDDRLRSGKQLCKKHVVTEVLGASSSPLGVDVTNIPFGATLPNSGQNTALWSAVQPTFSQGCVRESLYSPDVFETPNGASVPYYVPLSGLGLPIAFFDPYVSQTQSRDLRVIESTVDPDYRAKADLGELQISFDITDKLTLSSETAYNSDFVYSLQDFNRFDTAEGAWETVALSGQQARAKGLYGADGVFCDPQIGCSSRLVAIDISTAKSRQFSQELRLSSDFEGPFNFSLGANFLRYDTEDKYYVFINSLTLAAAATNTLYSPSNPWRPGASDNSRCQTNGLLPGDPTQSTSYACVYIDPNPIDSLNDQGHNYFLSKNPYKLISYAVFGEAYYNITDNLKVTAGLRWTVDKKEAPRIPSWTYATNRGYPVLEVLEQEWREPTGRLAIDWKPDLAFTDQTLLYASFAHGYKAGGANPPPMMEVGQGAKYYGEIPVSETRPKTFDPEFINAFELGAKNTLLDGRATLNLAAFYYDYTGYQVSEIVDRSAFNRNFDATIWGLEIETDWRPLENLKFGVKGGYENTRIADGERAIDLMDRTAGDPNWIVVRPFPTFASSCILPTWLFAHQGPLNSAPAVPGLYGLGAVGGGGGGGCELAYLAHNDPVTNAPYVDLTNHVGPIVTGAANTLGYFPAGQYPGWDPSTAPNNGEGIFKPLGGNQLPNAPHFTGTITADYTLPLPNDWLMTLHTDLYAQSNSWWRVFNDSAFDKLHPYFTMNLAAIFTNEEAGWKVMAYVKNVLDRDSITGAFLNSDDTGLTTNVFLTEPRLYGLRVTKEWKGGPLWGSFGARRNGPYPITIELGGQVQRQDAPNAALTPGFMGEFSPTLDPRGDQDNDLDWGDGRDVELTYASGPWRVSLGARFGKTNGATPWGTRRELGDTGCLTDQATCDYYTANNINGARELQITRDNYTISDFAKREDHTIVDFSVGKEVGFGLVDDALLSAGLRYAEFGSNASAHIFGVTHWEFPASEYLLFNKYDATHDRYDAIIKADREFRGAGPTLNWEASQVLLGSQDVGVLGLDWLLTGGVLFGKRKASITGQQHAEHFVQGGNSLSSRSAGLPVSTTPLPDISYARSKSVTVPTFGASLGLSYKVDRFKVDAGYRWERYQDAIDGGFTDEKAEDRTIDGPYFKIAVGFGG